ncbi:hypothetical protein [Streptomyces sp.]|uniref:hypothetical protein n=1 Tax=Streptomyces sp. TaxID=1931 RepID=UPI002F94990D
MNTAETPRQRLARLMDERRSDLHLTWNEVAERAGVTREGLRRTRTGTGHIRSLTKRGIERALSWEVGGVDEILAGVAPTERTPPRPSMEDAEVLARENSERAQRLARRIGRLDRRKQAAVEQMVDVLEGDPPTEREAQ